MALLEVSDFQMIFRYTNYMIYIYRWCIYIYRCYLYLYVFYKTSFFLVALKGHEPIKPAQLSCLLPWKLLPGSAEPQQLRLSIATAQVGFGFLDDDDGQLGSAQTKKSAPTFWEIFVNHRLLCFFWLVNNCAPHILRCFFW